MESVIAVDIEHRRPQELRELMRDADWDIIFLADSPFKYKTFRRKEDARQFPALIELGLKNGLKLPSGLNAGQGVQSMLDRIAARVSYRRTQSATVGVIGDVDRLTHPDLGLYPDDAGQAPADGVNAEHVAAVVRGRVRAGPVRIAPWAWTRASLVHHAIDRAAIGVELRAGDHLVTTELAYRLPTWDADSLYSIFAVHPTTDARVAWSAHGAFVQAWLRRYHDAETAPVAYGAPLTA